MDIYQIERNCLGSPFFFSKDTLRFFGQTMEGFNVEFQGDGRYMISQKMTDSDGTDRGMTRRFYNPKNKKLELV